MKTSYISASFIFLLFQSCIFPCSDEKLTIPKNNYYGTLRTDGYYYETLDKVDEKSYTSLLFLYRDGVIALGGGVPYSQLSSDTNLSFINGKRRILRDKDGLGAFIIANNEIQYQYWEPSLSGCKVTLMASGIILSDTSFKITNNATHGVERYYKFKKVTIKPDTTNLPF